MYTPEATGRNFFEGCSLSDERSTKSFNIYVDETIKENPKKLELNLNPELNQSFHTKRMVQKLADSLTTDRYALL